MIRIGVIGTGNIGRINTKAMLETKRAEIICFCNHHLEKAERLNDECHLSAALYRDSEKMLQHEQLDAVLICTPQDEHCKQFMLSAKHGIAAFVEKPLAMSSRECSRMIDIQKSTSLKACVCHTQRYRSAIIEMKRIIDSGELGHIVSVTDTIDMQYFTETRPKWCFEKKVRCAMLYTHGTHQIDRLMYLFGGSITWLDACIEYTDEYMPDLAILPLDCGYHIMGEINDVHFIVEGSAYSMPISSALTVRGTKGIAKVNLKNTGYEPDGLYISDNKNTFRQVPLSTSDEESYVRQMNDFLDYLEGKPNQVPTLAHAAKVIDTLETAMHSANEKRRICTVLSNPYAVSI